MRCSREVGRSARGGAQFDRRRLSTARSVPSFPSHLPRQLSGWQSMLRRIAYTRNRTPRRSPSHIAHARTVPQGSAGSAAGRGVRPGGPAPAAVVHGLVHRRRRDRRRAGGPARLRPVHQAHPHPRHHRARGRRPEADGVPAGHRDRALRRGGPAGASRRGAVRRVVRAHDGDDRTERRRAHRRARAAGTAPRQPRGRTRATRSPVRAAGGGAVAAARRARARGGSAAPGTGDAGGAGSVGRRAVGALRAARAAGLRQSADGAPAARRAARTDGPPPGALPKPARGAARDRRASPAS